MEFDLLGWPADGPTLRLDYEQFSYAGKFVMSSTGKAVALVDSPDGAPSNPDSADGDTADLDSTDVLAAVSFDPDRTDPDTLRVRYVTVRADRRGDGIGPRLLRFTADRALAREFDRVTIAVNNPFAYEAAYRAGFAFTGDTTGIAELVCEFPPVDATTERYQTGLDVFRERDLSAEEEQFLADRQGRAPPDSVESPV